MKDKTHNLKAFGWITGILGLIGIGAYAVKQYKKTLTDIEQEEEEQESKVEEALGCTKEMAEEIVHTNTSITKAAFIACSGSRQDLRIEDDAFDLDESFKNQDVIHVKTDMQSGKEQIDFIYQIPEGVLSRRSNFYISDYKDSINDRVKIWYEDHLIDTKVETVASKWVGFVVVQYSVIDKEQDTQPEPIVEILELDRYIYANFKTSRKGDDGLIPFYLDYLENGKRVDEESLQRLQSYLRRKYNRYEEITREVSIRDVFIGYKVSFPVMTSKEVNGLDAITIAKLTKDSWNYIRPERNQKMTSWDHVMFHPSDDNNKGIMNVAFVDGGVDDYYQADLDEE